LQTWAEGVDHTVDEWWDDAIGDYLKWLFAHHHYDAFIVNYTFLSKALIYAPRHVYRILDTHDKFTGRRELLQSQGIAAEFFHLSAEEEAIALNRTDLVWAIKKEEEEFFRSIAPTSVCTVPHIEPYQLVERVTSPEDEDYLVLGMIGVGNSVNITNARAFVEQAVPQFRKYLAPIKIKFAGSLCDAIEDLAERSGIELMGRVENIEDFYKAIDVAIIPMSFSTGLKIKAVEALTKGVPIIAHRHAFEGIPTTHPYHTCDSFQQMADYCLELAYNRNQLQELAHATEFTYHKVRQQVEGAMTEVARKIAKSKPQILIVLPQDFFNRDCVTHYHLRQTLDYFKNFASLIYYIHSPIDSKGAALLKFDGARVKIVLSPQALENSPSRQDLCFTIGYSVSTLEQICQNRKIAALWLWDLPEELETGIPKAVKNIPTYVRADVLDIENPAKPLREFSQITLVHSGTKFLFHSQSAIPHAERLIVPYWRYLLSQIRDQGVHKTAVILANSHSLEVAYTLWNMCIDISDSQLAPLVIVTEKPEDNQEQLWSKDSKFLSSLFGLSEVMGDFKLFGQLPKLVIDISSENLAFAPYRETVKRAAIPLIMPSAEASLSWKPITSSSGVLQPLSVFHLIDLIAQFVADEDTFKETLISNRKAVNFEYAKEAGWATVYRQMKKDLIMSDLKLSF
jgi:glycosyltransferase involved in cell wall biosynthesis